MTTPQLRVRRATVEDLPQLVALWEAEGFPVQALERHFQEFQVAAGPGGEVHGAIALQIAGTEGRIHSEAFVHPENADTTRDCLLQRLLVVMQNHGLYRTWTQLDSPFWHRNGFQPVAGDLRSKLPAAFGQAPHPWFVLKLRDEISPAISIEKEFALFREAEKQQTEKIYRQARRLKILATAIAVAVLLLILASLALLFFRTKMQKERGREASRPRRQQCAASDSAGLQRKKVEQFPVSSTSSSPHPAQSSWWCLRS